MVDGSSIASRAQLPAAPAGWFDYGYAVLMDGRLALIRTRLDFHTEWQRWREATSVADKNGTIRPPYPDFWNDIRLSVFDGVVETDVVVVPTGALPIVDRMADGRWLVASVRAGEDERNGRVYSLGGGEERALQLGDGIEQMLCSPDGTVWVSYFDEGVFGGSPPSTGGIVQFDALGRVLWSFNDEARNQFPDGQRVHVDDCYAMTLTGSILWACYYTDFPVVRVDAGTIALWENAIAAATAIVVAGDVVVLAGFNYEDANRIVVAKVEGNASREIGGLRFDPVVQASGARLQMPGRPEFIYNFDSEMRTGARLLRGRDGVLHGVHGGVWFKISVADAVAAAERGESSPVSPAAPTLWLVVGANPPPGVLISSPQEFGAQFFRKKPENGQPET